MSLICICKHHISKDCLGIVLQKSLQILSIYVFLNAHYVIIVLSSLLCLPHSMSPSLYASFNLCLPQSMSHSLYVSLTLCLPRYMYPLLYVSLTLCIRHSMYPSLYVSVTLCIPHSMSTPL